MIEIVARIQDIDRLGVLYAVRSLHDVVSLQQIQQDFETFCWNGPRAPKLLRWADNPGNDVILGFETETDAVMFILSKPLRADGD